VSRAARCALFSLLVAGCGDSQSGLDLGGGDDLATGQQPDFYGEDLTGVDLAMQGGPVDMATQGGQQDFAMVPPKLTSTVTVYVEPGAGTTPLTSAIKGAKTSIDLEMYLLSDNTLINALCTAQGSGRKVRVIVQSKNTANFVDNTTAYNTLMACGAQVAYSNPAYTLTHEKAMIVDGATLWAMTMNFTATAVNGNREYVLADTDPTDVAEAEAVFNADLARSPTPPIQDLVIAPVNCYSKLGYLIGSATTSIDVEWEELSDNNIGSDIQQRIKAGATARLIVPSNPAPATSNLLMALKGGGAQVKTLASPTPHAKMVLIDKARGFIGSENATNSSLSQNRELGVLWQNATVASTVSTTFDSDWAAATPF
jgi:phosphatidylserine/phosphatidylglycerophosphate/cardiolipin synthase-like enzyme